MRSFLTTILGALLALSAPAVAQEQPDQTIEASEAELLETADTIANQVAVIRGLPLTAPIKKGIKRREELRGVLVAKLAEEVSDAQIEAEGLVYKRLGLIPADMDYKKVLLDVLAEQIAGFYDQKTKELYVMRGIPMSFQKPAMAHELFHAIQDQHFDIQKMQAGFTSTENGDFALARSALIEGDATIVMLDYSLYAAGSLPQGDATSVIDIPFIAGTLRNMSFDDLSALEQLMGQTSAPADMQAGAAALTEAPTVFKELLMFPYFAGMRFVVTSRIGRSWKDFDEVYANPPVSTEQILHPEKYYAQDDPQFLSMDVANVLPGYELIHDTVLGEFQTRLWLKLMMGEAGYDAAAAGWDGDRLIALKKGEHVVVASVFAWDSEDDAKEFHRALITATNRRYAGVKRFDHAGKVGESTCFITTPEESVYVERWGDLVIYIEGAPAADDGVNAMRAAIASTLKRESLAALLAQKGVK